MKTRIISETAQRFAKMYREGRLSQDAIKEMEAINNATIEEIVQSIESVSKEKKYNICLMTITELRNWKKRNDISEREKQLYEKYSGCTYEKFEKFANERLEEHEEKKRIRNKIKQENREFMSELLKNGRAELVKSEYGSYVKCDVRDVLEHIKSK